MPTWPTRPVREYPWLDHQFSQRTYKNVNRTHLRSLVLSNLWQHALVDQDQSVQLTFLAIPGCCAFLTILIFHAGLVLLLNDPHSCMSRLCAFRVGNSGNSILSRWPELQTQTSFVRVQVFTLDSDAVLQRVAPRVWHSLQGVLLTAVQRGDTSPWPLTPEQLTFAMI